MYLRARPRSEATEKGEAAGERWSGGRRVTSRSLRMGNSLRCCLACVLPCGALDVVRVVHLNGQVEEHSGPVLAGQILAANPNHALSKPCSHSQGGGGGVRRILIVSPDSELERGKIYFLIPATAVPAEKERHRTKKERRNARATRATATPGVAAAADPSLGGVAECCSLAEILSEKRTRHRRRRSGRVGVWRPHLESIHELDP